MSEISKHYVLHIFPYEKFTVGMVDFFNSNYGIDNNLFILYGNQGNFVGDLNKLISYGNVYMISKLSKKEITFFIINAKKVILHVYNIRLAMKIFFYRKKNIYTVLWGGDLEKLKKINIRGIKGKFRFLISKFLFKYYIPINLIENDFKVLSKELDITFKQHFVAGYYNDLYEKQLMKFPYMKKNLIPKILVGNSATITNNHKEVFDILKRFNDRKMEIYVPLSYGDNNYAKEVMSYANKVIDNKLIFLTDFMNPVEYNQFLNTVDIGIFNYHRQQGLGNIKRLLLLQKKVYVNKKSGLYDYNKEQGITIYDIELLKSVSYEEFIQYDEDKYLNNRRIQETQMSNVKFVKEWDALFKD